MSSSLSRRDPPVATYAGARRTRSFIIAVTESEATPSEFYRRRRVGSSPHTCVGARLIHDAPHTRGILGHFRETLKRPARIFLDRFFLVRALIYTPVAPTARASFNRRRFCSPRARARFCSRPQTFNFTRALYRLSFAARFLREGAAASTVIDIATFSKAIIRRACVYLDRTHRAVIYARLIVSLA